MYRYLWFWAPRIDCTYQFDFKCKEWLVYQSFSDFSEKNNDIVSDFNFFKVYEYNYDVVLFKIILFA